MDDCPSLAVLTLHNKKGEDIVKGILDVEVVPTPSVEQNGVHYWNWKIKNKYYTADIHLASLPSAESHKEWILNNCEALIIYCDSTVDEALENLNNIVETLGSFEPEVQLLVCDSCSSVDSSPGLSRLKAQQWCISNGWELIELDKIEDDDSGHEDDFPESWGFQRIRQALHANTWSNLEMNETSNANSLSAVMQSVVSADERNAENLNEVLYSRLEDMSLLDSDNGVNSSLENYFEEGEEDFEKLFSSFEHMKRTAESLPPEHRRDYAEKVAISFWKAIGGPEEELDGLDSD